MPSTITMERDGKSADVHPDEFDNYKRGGWIEIMPVKKTKATNAPGVTAPKKATKDKVAE